MYFVELQERLIGIARHRVRAGLVTERRLARLSGISQPHMHNVFKNIRSLSPASADKLLRGLDLTIPDLLWRPTGEAEPETRSVPVLRMAVGPGREANFTVHRGHMPMPSGLLKDLVDPVLARLSPDLALPRPFAPNDLVLLDQNPILRNVPHAAGYWVIADGSGLRVRYLRSERTKIFIASEIDAEPPDGWRVLDAGGRSLPDLVKARVVWFARELQPLGSEPPELWA